MASWSIVSGIVGADIVGSWVWWISAVLYSQAVMAKPGAVELCEQKQDL